MENPGDSPQATRRRAGYFVLASLVVLLVAALWPLKGYRIDQGTFGIAISSPIPEGQSIWRVAEGGYWINLTFFPAETVRDARQNLLGKAHQMASIRPVVTEMPGFHASVYSSEDDPPNGFILVFQRSNIVGFAMVTKLPHDKTKEQSAAEILTAILDGIDREIPGVTTYYNPPARQLWIDRVRPFLEEHFPK